MSKPLEKEFKYFLAHRDELVQQYAGKVIVIKDCKVIGSYESKTEAVSKTQQAHELGTFLVQKCDKDESSVSMTFHSRFAFAK